MPEPFHVTLALYNSAGERVRLLYSGSSQKVPTRLDLRYLDFGANGVPVAISIDGLASALAPPPLVWSGDNDSGQRVANGIYYLKMESTDPFGGTSACIKEVEVLGNGVRNSLSISNSAGETVRWIPLDSYPYGVADFSIRGESGASPGQIRFDLTDLKGGAHAFIWDGCGDSGQPLNSGSYTVMLLRQEPGQSAVVKSRPLLLIKAPGSAAQDAAASLVAGPNPLTGPDPSLVLSYLPVARGSACARFYSLAGELIAQASAQNNSGRLVIQVGGVADGVYLVVFEVREGHSVLARKVIKVAVLRKSPPL